MGLLRLGVGLLVEVFESRGVRSLGRILGELDMSYSIRVAVIMMRDIVTAPARVSLRPKRSIVCKYNLIN
jgi:hypothetical protein